MSCQSTASSSELTRYYRSCPSHRESWNIKGDYDKGRFKWESDTFCNQHSLNEWHVELLVVTSQIQLFLCHHACKNERVIASYNFVIQSDNNIFYRHMEISEKTQTFSGNIHVSSKSLDYGILGFPFHLHLEIIEVIALNFTKNQESLLYSDVYRLWEERKFCDFVISVEGKDIPVHRLILAGASPVFEAMLEHDMLEKAKDRIVIKDYKVEVIEQLLQYVYTRKNPDFKSFSLDICFDLLKAANQYGLNVLPSIISPYLISILSVENVSEILLVADQQSVAELKECAMDFIYRNGVKLIEKDYLNKLEGEEQLWKEIALRRLERA